MESKRWHISPEQWSSIKKAVIKYILPLVIGFLTEIQLGHPVEQAARWLYAAALSLVINILSKLVTET